MDNFAFYTDKEKKLKELRSKEEKIEVKAGTEIIGPFAFRAPNAKEIILPDSVEVVQRYAFEKFSRRILVTSVVMQRACTRLHQHDVRAKQTKVCDAERTGFLLPHMYPIIFVPTGKQV